MHLFIFESEHLLSTLKTAQEMLYMLLIYTLVPFTAACHFVLSSTQSVHDIYQSPFHGTVKVKRPVIPP